MLSYLIQCRPILTPSMPENLRRLIVLVAVMLISILTLRWVRSGFETTVSPLQWDLSGIQAASEHWTGKDVPITDDTVRVLGADSHINRLYRDSVGRVVAFHVAVWSDPEYCAGTPHHPEECYRAAGWEIMQRRNATWNLEIGEVPVELIAFQKGQEHLITAHWYQMGSYRFTNSSGIYSQAFRLWGKSNWACTEKYLLQTKAQSIDSAEPILHRLASSLRWPSDG